MIISNKNKSKKPSSRSFEITNYGIRRTTDINQRITLLENALNVVDLFIKEARPLSESTDPTTGHDVSKKD